MRRRELTRIRTNYTNSSVRGFFYSPPFVFPHSHSFAFPIRVPPFAFIRLSPFAFPLLVLHSPPLPFAFPHSRSFASKKNPATKAGLSHLVIAIKRDHCSKSERL